MDIIEKYNKEKERFEDACRIPLEQEIKDHLSKLDEGEEIPLSSSNCDGNGIAVLVYSDTINKVDKEGNCIVYNNYDCDPECSADGNVFGWSLEVTIEILKCVREYMKDRIKFNVEPCDIKNKIETLKHDIKLIEKGFDNPNPISAQEMEEEEFQISVKKELIKELETLIK
jgi:hypothetical protein